MKNLKYDTEINVENMAMGTMFNLVPFVGHSFDIVKATKWGRLCLRPIEINL